LYFLLPKFTFKTNILIGFIVFEPIIFYPGDLISLLSTNEVLNGLFLNTRHRAKVTLEILGIRGWKRRAEDLRKMEASC